MPLTKKGEEIKSAMQKQYGEKKGESVFYASRNKGTITGVDTITPMGTEARTNQVFGATQQYKNQVIATGMNGMDAIDKGIPIHGKKG
jgi:hypothetical protein